MKIQKVTLLGLFCNSGKRQNLHMRNRGLIIPIVLLRGSEIFGSGVLLQILLAIVGMLFSRKQKLSLSKRHFLKWLCANSIAKVPNFLKVSRRLTHTQNFQSKFLFSLRRLLFNFSPLAKYTHLVKFLARTHASITLLREHEICLKWRQTSSGGFSARLSAALESAFE